MNEEEAATTNDARSEWIKFGVLVAVFVIVILVVALSRPLIFGHIVPAIMGNGQSAAVTKPIEAEPAPAEAVDTAYPEPAAEEPAEPVEETPVEQPATTETTEESSSTETAVEETTPTTETEATESTAEEAAADTPQQDNSFEYTIRPGDTLYDIARRYGTTAEEIIAANDSLSSLQDPIIPNTTIIIPRR